MDMSQNTTPEKPATNRGFAQFTDTVKSFFSSPLMLVVGILALAAAALRLIDGLMNFNAFAFVFVLLGFAMLLVTGLGIVGMRAGVTKGEIPVGKLGLVRFFPRYMLVIEYIVVILLSLIMVIATAMMAAISDAWDEIVAKLPDEVMENDAAMEIIDKLGTFGVAIFAVITIVVVVGGVLAIMRITLLTSMIKKTMNGLKTGKAPKINVMFYAVLSFIISLFMLVSAFASFKISFLSGLDSLIMAAMMILTAVSLIQVKDTLAQAAVQYREDTAAGLVSDVSMIA